MDSRSLSKTTNQTIWRHKTNFDYLIVASLVTLVIIVLAAHGIASAQGPPDQEVSEHALGTSPFADQLRGEEPITVTGILNILIEDDFANKRSKTNYFLKDAKTKETYKLRFSKKAPGHLRSGATVKIRGRAKGRELYLALDESGEESIETVLPAQVVVAGEQKTLVMVANFIDASVSCPVDEIQDLMFTDPTDSSIDDLYQETSLGLVWFSGDVVGSYTIDYRSTDSCDVNAWAAAADAAALADGVDFSAYDRKVYVLPQQNTCGWSGLASVGGNPSYAWIFRCDMEAVYGHELGHNLGMNHAATLAHEYGDTSDIMGAASSGLRQINAPHQEQMGWRTAGQIITVTEDGDYEIAPLELGASDALAPQVLKITKPDTDEHYYLSYRQQIGFDANLGSELSRRLHIHRYNGNGARTWLLRGLLDGENFVDEINGLTIMHISHTADYATVQIQFNSDGRSCITAAPVADISPASRTTAPGTRLDYTVTVSNADSANCAASTFSLNATLPNGWTGAVSPDTIDLPPGQTGTATLSLTSPDGATEASYGFTVNVTDAAEPAHIALTGASYVVELACSPGTPIAGISPASQSAVAGTTLDYTVTVSNTDSANCASSTFSLSAALPGGWTGNVSPGTLTLPPGQSGSATLSVTSPDGAAEASYGFTVNVSDASKSVHSASTGAGYVVEGITEVDTEAPTVPGGLSAGFKGKNIKLTWNPATDNVGVSGYAVWRDGARIGDTTGTGYVDSSVPSGMTCAYMVSAYDAAGNPSASSSAVTVTTRGGSKGGGKGKPK